MLISANIDRFTGVPCVQLLLHGGITHSLSEPVASAEPDPHPADTCSLVRLLLLPAVRGGEVPGGLGVPVPTRGVRHAHAQVPRLSLLVYPHAHHHRWPAHPRDQCRVSPRLSLTIIYRDLLINRNVTRNMSKVSVCNRSPSESWPSG